MGRNKKLMDKTTDAVTNAAQTVTKGLKSAGHAVAEAITPKPVRAGDTLIIPSGDPSVPPVVVPVKKRPRRTTRKTRTGRLTAKSTAPSRGGKAKTSKAASARKPPAKSRASRTGVTRKTSAEAKHNTRRMAGRGPGRKAASRRSGKVARR